MCVSLRRTLRVLTPLIHRTLHPDATCRADSDPTAAAAAAAAAAGDWELAERAEAQLAAAGLVQRLHAQQAATPAPAVSAPASTSKARSTAAAAAAAAAAALGAEDEAAAAELVARLVAMGMREEARGVYDAAAALAPDPGRLQRRAAECLRPAP
jgi:hypothetical protein